MVGFSNLPPALSPLPLVLKCQPFRSVNQFLLSLLAFSEREFFYSDSYRKKFSPDATSGGGGGAWKPCHQQALSFFKLRFFFWNRQNFHNNKITLFKPFEINRSLYTSWFTYVLKKKSSWFLKWSKFVRNGLWEPFRTCKNSVIMACSGHSASKTKCEGNSAKVAEQWKTGGLGLSRLPRFFTLPLVLHLLLFRFVLLTECLEQAVLITKA